MTYGCAVSDLTASLPNATGGKEPTGSFVLTLACPDRIGIVHAVSGLLAEHGYNIVESQQFGDGETGRFFMRVHVASVRSRDSSDELHGALSELGRSFEMDWGWHDLSYRPKLLILVSRFGHCLNDLLYRYRIGALPVRIPAIVSNHTDFDALADSYGIPFHHLPVTPETKSVQEADVLEIAERNEVDLVVLARYMQILTAGTAKHLSGRAINIHHGLLPSFKGAKPYRQAYDRGVKVIGATAHYVTEQLDEGPIIDQAVEAVDHTLSPSGLAAVGRDLECRALARAVTWHVSHRVLLNGNRTVVFH